MKQHFVIAFMAYFSSLMWMIIILALWLHSDITLVVMFYIILIIPNLFCAGLYTFEYAGPKYNQESPLKDYILYFVIGSLRSQRDAMVTQMYERAVRGYIIESSPNLRAYMNNIEAAT